MRLPNGYHVTSDSVGDGAGLTKAELLEERAARGAPLHGQQRKRKAPPVKNPFDEMLRTIGVYDWVKPLCNGVSMHELPCGSKARRVQAVRKQIFVRLRELHWSYEQIAQLFGYASHTVIMDALNGNKRGERK